MVSVLFGTTLLSAARIALKPVPPPVGDLDDDGTVTAADLAILLASWGPCPQEGDRPADFDGNGSVVPAELATLLANWG